MPIYNNIGPTAKRWTGVWSHVTIPFPKNLFWYVQQKAVMHAVKHFLFQRVAVLRASQGQSAPRSQIYGCFEHNSSLIPL